ncbi:MAG: glycosyltransferase family 4 protein [Crocosphaera sp.]|nr:glycosyltransferase family 4 protein [Crocosphaera sp.]
MKQYHIALSRHFDLQKIDEEAQAKKRPRHTMSLLSQKLDAKVYEPGGLPLSLSDRILPKLTGGSNSDHFALGRFLGKKLTSDDVIFSIAEDSGFPIAINCGNNRPKNVVFIHNPNRLRGRLTLKLFNLAQLVDLFITNTAFKADFLRDYLNLPPEKVYLVAEQTDTQFFTPGLSSPQKPRPIIGSGGLEQRDYKTLAKAITDLDVDLKVCAVSPNAKTMRDTFPKVLPKNMSVGYYDWADLLQLYRDSDVVVISLKDHNYQAGLTTLFESLACKRPVIMTRTIGLVEEFADAGLIMTVHPNDPKGMRSAILELLNNPDKAQAMATRGYERVRKNHNSECYVEDLAQKILNC